jgi:DmsE family decaheme c-type cytochrome
VRWWSTVLLSGLLLLAMEVCACAAEATGFVGDAACKECHAASWESHALSFHGKTWTGKGYGCESCHGSAAEHLKSPDKTNIIGPGTKDPDRQEALCRDCHGAGPRFMYWDDSVHKRQDVVCTSCHTLHTKKPDKAAIGERCLSCHRDVRAETTRFSHHPIVEGKVGCSDCHDPHGSPSDAMLKAESINLLCYTCHAEKRGPYVWQHPPVEENCLICHAPHGSKTGKLLNERLPNLCQECHNAGGHPSNAYGSQSSFSSIASGRSCLNCHGQVHGSNVGSGNGRLFFR